MQDYKFDSYENKSSLLGGKYQYISPIQEGSFGKVTLAYNTELKCEVAMKAMYKHQPEIKRMANHEIKMLTKLGSKSDNICQLLDHFETDEYVVLVLEYCSSGDLYDLIHSGLNISAVDLWHIAKELSSGVKYAHSLGIYHRDIKPENVLFNSFGRVKLCDWGLSTTVRHSNQFNVGTEKYLAPECFKNEEEKRSGHEDEGDDTYDCKYADYWSLGITLLTAVFGTSPFKPVGVSSSLESDTNFKNFVHFGKIEVLYDIYPTMNKNCFEIFMNLLKTGEKDDRENKNRKISSRDLNLFLHDLELNWKFGLSIDEEYELEQLDEEDNAKNHKDSDLFDMDDDDLGYGSSKQDSLTDPTNYDDDDSELDELEDFIGVTNSIKIPNRNGNGTVGGQPGTHRNTMHAHGHTVNSIPSLIESTSGKSWCDFDDADDAEGDVEEEDEEGNGNTLSLLIEGLKVKSELNTIKEERNLPISGKLREIGVTIQEQELDNEWHAYRA